MHIEFTNGQLTGLILVITGLFLNVGGIIYFLFRIRTMLRADGVKPKGLQFRLVIRAIFSREKKRKYQRMLTFLRWLMLIPIGMLLLGFGLLLFA